MTKEFQALEEQFRAELRECATTEQIAVAKSRMLGKSGAVSGLMAKLKDLPNDERKSFGAGVNALKETLERLAASRLEEVEQQRIQEELERTWIDPTLRRRMMSDHLPPGGMHPITRVRAELEDYFVSMGFEVIGGPHIEDEYHNFDALNMPGDHPSRDLQDTFWFPDRKHLLRTQTSNVQIRGMKTRTPPFRFVAPGKVFRCERTDATHESVFHQLEGMYVDEHISLSHLLYFAKSLFAHIFKREVELRVRPSYFPFVEPGIEIDCSYEKGWLELMGAGMVHPAVLRAGGIDPERYRGFAFGLGIDRLTLLRYGIDDIRHVHAGDLRFAKQFPSF